MTTDIARALATDDTEWVLDNSVAMRWILSDQTTPETDGFLDRVSVDTVRAPALWRQEVAQALVAKSHSSELAAADAFEMLSRLLGLPVLVDATPDRSGYLALLALALRLGLKLPDTAYVGIAWRRRLPLVTLDRQQADRARAFGVRVVWPLPALYA